MLEILTGIRMMNCVIILKTWEVTVINNIFVDWSNNIPKNSNHTALSKETAKIVTCCLKCFVVPQVSWHSSARTCLDKLKDLAATDVTSNPEKAEAFFLKNFTSVVLNISGLHQNASHGVPFRISTEVNLLRNGKNCSRTAADIWNKWH